MKKNPKRYFDGAMLEAARALDTGNQAQVRELVSQGAFGIHDRGRKDMTLLWYAMLKENYDGIRLLVELGSDPDGQTVKGLSSPLYTALENENVRFLQAMLNGGLSPDHQTQHGMTLLQRAMIGPNSLEHVKLLVERGADVNLKDSIGGTALHEAISKPDIAIYLIEQGADVNATLTNGVTVAWSVYSDIEHLQPDAPQPEITDYTLDEEGHPVTQTVQPPPPGLSEDGQQQLKNLKRLRDMLIERGVQWPPDPPAKVREWMKEQGMKVAE